MCSQSATIQFWDACWPQPCNLSRWDFGGYTPLALANADGVLAESWVQGSLVGGVQALYALGTVGPATLLLVDDTPNCDLQPSHACATGSLEGDVAAYTEKLAALGLRQWAVWDSVDGGVKE